MISWNLLAFLLFTLEFYHVLGHVAILFRVRLLPRKDLVRIRWYFLFDTLTVFATAFLFTGKLRWLAAVQIVQHLFYFITWDQGYMAKKIIDWSSLEWFRRKNGGEWQMDSILGTAFDVVVHAANMVVLARLMTGVEVLLGLAIAQVGAYLILYNPRFAWSSPYSMPSWVERRLWTTARPDQSGKVICQEEF